MDSGMVLYWFIYSLPPFFIELIIGEGMFSYRLKRREWFWARLAVGLVISVGMLYLAAVLTIAFMNINFILICLVYIGIFMYTVGVMAICFDESFFTLLFCAVAGYALQNLAYRVFSLIELTGVVWTLTEKIGYWGGYVPLFFVNFVVLAVPAYFIFVRRMNKDDVAHLHNVKVFAISIIALVVTVVLCTWMNGYTWQSPTLSLISYIFSCLSCIFVLCLQSGMLQAVGLKQDIEVIRELWAQDKKQYEISRESIDLINIKCHDLRFRLQTLRTAEGNVSKDELEEIESAISIYDSKINTGCAPLDTILTEKSLFCNKNGITLTCMADGSKLSFIAPPDLYSLFGNIISNAVEAVCRVADREHRLINFQVKQVGDMLLVATENYYEGGLIFKEGVLLTSKEDKLNHGYGFKSIQMLVKKYGGDMNVSAENNIFHLKILFPLVTENTKV